MFENTQRPELSPDQTWIPHDPQSYGRQITMIMFDKDLSNPFSKIKCIEYIDTDQNGTFIPDPIRYRTNRDPRTITPITITPKRITEQAFRNWITRKTASPTKSALTA